MRSPREQLVAELVAERYGPVRRWSAPTSAQPDSPAAVAERQRVLCAALDGSHLVAVDSPPASAA